MSTTNYYQLWLFPFLSLHRHHVSAHIGRQYYHSFEDGLWSILAYRGVPKGSAILVPDFYCEDVRKNIRLHGYRPVAYALNRHFQANPRALRALMRKTRPSAIIIFHAAGITSNILPLFAAMHEGLLVIEDSVHRIVDPETVHIMHRNHYLMDSLRKVTPLPGSRLFGFRAALPPHATGFSLNRYVIATSWWFFLFRATYLVGMLAGLPAVVRYAHEVILKRHDDIIGDPLTPARGIPWPLLFSDRIDTARIARRKSEQVMKYRNLLTGLPAHLAYRVRIRPQDYGHLHAYPVGLYGKAQPAFIRYLHRHGVVVWHKYPDTAWSRKHSVLYLPLGFHVRDGHIRHIAWHVRTGLINHQG